MGGPKLPREAIDESFVRDGYRMLFDIPHLAGADDPAEPWWPLADDEATALAEPTARMLARMPKATQEVVSRFLDPIALVLAAVIITQPRVQKSLDYARLKQIERTEENILERNFSGRRAERSTRLSQTDGESSGRVDDSLRAEDQSGRTGSGRNHHLTVQDVYSQD